MKRCLLGLCILAYLLAPPLLPHNSIYVYASVEESGAVDPGFPEGATPVPVVEPVPTSELTPLPEPVPIPSTVPTSELTPLPEPVPVPSTVPELTPIPQPIPVPGPAPTPGLAPTPVAPKPPLPIPVPEKILKVKPPALHPGATIGVVALSYPADREKLNKGVAYLKSEGFKVVLGEHVFAKSGFTAGTAQSRAADLNKMFANPQIDAIFCVRGGYGSAQMIEFIDFDLIRKNPKIFMGYSDVTYLLLAITQKTGLITFHGPMVESDMSKEEFKKYNKEAMRKVLYNNKLIGKVTPPTSYRPFFINGGEARGELTGGNLSMVVSTLGTPHEIDTEGKILFLEETGEVTYRIDRMLCQLQAAGKLRDAVGIIFGESVSCGPRTSAEPTLLEVVKTYTKDLHIPVLYGLPFGHGSYKATLPIGITAILDSKKGLYIPEAAVK